MEWRASISEDELFRDFSSRYREQTKMNLHGDKELSDLLDLNAVSEALCVEKSETKRERRRLGQTSRTVPE